MPAKYPDSLINTRAPRYAIARAPWVCGHCGELIDVYALVLPEAYETKEADEQWASAGLPAVIFYVDYLSEPVRKRMREESRHYWLDLDAGSAVRHFMNHCGHCGAQNTDRFLHEELPGAFCGQVQFGAPAIDLVEVNQPLLAGAAGFAIEPDFCARMPRIG